MRNWLSGAHTVMSRTRRRRGGDDREKRHNKDEEVKK
jgi:hypothetical protein